MDGDGQLFSLDIMASSRRDLQVDGSLEQLRRVLDSLHCHLCHFGSVSRGDEAPSSLQIGSEGKENGNSCLDRKWSVQWRFWGEGVRDAVVVFLSWRPPCTCADSRAVPSEQDPGSADTKILPFVLRKFLTQFLTTLAMPQGIVYHLENDDLAPWKKHCTPTGLWGSREAELAYFSLKGILVLGVPCATILVCYSCMFWKLWKLYSGQNSYWILSKLL